MSAGLTMLACMSRPHADDFIASTLDELTKLLYVSSGGGVTQPCSYESEVTCLW